MSVSTISVIGLGYIGLPTAAVFASRKMHVIGVDVNEHAVNTINKGGIHIIEPDLDMVVQAAVQQGYLRATTQAEPADAFLIAVPTPLAKESRGPDIQFIRNAADAIAPVLQAGNLVILESTSPVGTTEQLAAWLAAARPDLSFPQDKGEDSDIRIAYCPERVLPGHILRELVQNDRVIGGMTDRCAQAACELYKKFVEGECLTTTARTAEMVKLTENSFRDVNIAFANELSIICDRFDINVWELIEHANRHPRVNILKPGPGVGGHCIAVDPWFIVSGAPEDANLIRTAREVNESKPGWVVKKVHEAIRNWTATHPDQTAAQVSVACYGLAFKADIDDLRESPALQITQRIAAEHSGPVLAVEPNIKTLPKDVHPNVTLVDVETAARDAVIRVLLVDHRAFERISFSRTATSYSVIDTRGMLESQRARQ